jgi:Ca2+-binding RTX toxin-like protein
MLMATVPGSQFSVTAFGASGPNSGDVNFAVLTGTDATAPSIAAGSPVLSPSGLELDLIAGAFAVTDNGSGNDTAQGGGGPDTITVYGNFDSVSGGGGNDTIGVTGQNDTVTVGGGSDLINVTNSSDVINGGSGSDTITASANFDTINGGSGADSISVTGTFDLIKTGIGSDTVNVTGSNDTVMSGAGAGAGQNALINLTGGNMTIADGPNTYSDTVVGFDQSAGDTIQLTGTDTSVYAVAHQTPENGGQDTLITLNDGSTILLKGVSHIDSTFFS